MLVKHGRKAVDQDFILSLNPSKLGDVLANKKYVTIPAFSVDGSNFATDHTRPMGQLNFDFVTDYLSILQTLIKVFP